MSEGQETKPIAVAIIGASQSGKSTLLGQLAWPNVTDEERATGRTMGIRTTYNVYGSGPNTWLFAFLDCPGHPDHFEKAITGISQADSALIVVDASEGIFEESMKKGSHLWKLVFAANTLGMKNFFCVVNMLDKVGNSETRYNEVVEAMTTFLKPLGIKPIDFISTATGSDGMKIRIISGLEEHGHWYRNKERPLRMCIHEEREPERKHHIFRGRVDSGLLNVGMTVHVGNTGATGVVNTVERDFRMLPFRVTAQIVAIGVGPSNDLVTDIQPGDVIGDPSNDPPKPAERFTVRLNAIGNLKKGSTVTVDIGTAHAPCRIDTIPKLMTMKGELLGNDVSDVSEGQACIAVLVPDPNARPVCVDKYSENPFLGRLLVRDGLALLGMGMVMDVVERS